MIEREKYILTLARSISSRTLLLSSNIVSAGLLPPTQLIDRLSYVSACPGVFKNVRTSGS